MSDFYVIDHVDYLNQEFQNRKSRRPLYSLRAFARDLGLAPSSLTDFFKNRIYFTEARTQQIGQRIGLTPEQIQHWNDLMEVRTLKNLERKKILNVRIQSRIRTSQNKLEIEEFQVISEWFHLALLELIEMNPAKYQDLKLAAKDLNLPLRTVHIAFKRLIKLKLLNIQSDGSYQIVASTKVGSETTPAAAIRNFMHQVLNKAARAIDTQDLKHRFSTATFISLTTQDRKQLIQELDTFTMKLLTKYINKRKSTIPRNELYCLTLQFFNLLKESDSEIKPQQLKNRMRA